MGFPTPLLVSLGVLFAHLTVAVYGAEILIELPTVKLHQRQQANSSRQQERGSPSDRLSSALHSQAVGRDGGGWELRCGGGAVSRVPCTTHRAADPQQPWKVRAGRMLRWGRGSAPCPASALANASVGSPISPAWEEALSGRLIWLNN